MLPGPGSTFAPLRTPLEIVYVNVGNTGQSLLMRCADQQVIELLQKVAEAWRHQPDRLVQFARFAVVGLLTTGIYLTSTQMFHRYGLSLSFAATASFCIVVLISYLMHHAWTYRSVQRHGVAAPRFTVMVMGGMAINGLTVALGSHWPGVSHLTVLLTGIGLVVVWNYVLSRCWVFADPRVE